ncbi:unnamed protein product [Tuber melanosporum]|uniref:(Perigord truffle) hypothetical protein n=1 Tax=Tuber melanosporum (strain Mel28) TaxID=656061 RepID=D5GAY3_TUBMM|nr:unnamed protein product [Tuber melanosporum]
MEHLTPISINSVIKLHYA